MMIRDGLEAEPAAHQVGGAPPHRRRSLAVTLQVEYALGQLLGRRHGAYQARHPVADHLAAAGYIRGDYGQFGKADTSAAKPDETMAFTIVKRNGAQNGFNQWTLNGEAFSMATMKPTYKVQEGHRYRLKFRNASDDIHPLHLHRHSFELVRVGGKPTAGVLKDVVMLGGFQEIEFDFVADNPGRTLFHCHQQLHMDFGFMALFDYA